MLRLAVMSVMSVMLLVSGRVDGKLTLPPLPMKDGCYQVSAEVEVFRTEGEAVILSFPLFQRVVAVRNLAPPTATYLITKGNGTAGGVANGGVAYGGPGRVQQRGRNLRLLPARAFDSGEYVSTYRNESFCVSGRISLQVLESHSADAHKAFYPITASVGQSLSYRCPALGPFNRSDTLVQWFKENSSSVSLPSGRVGSSGILSIATVRRSHAGLYTCQLRVLIEQQPYQVSRVVLLQVHGSDPDTSTTVPDISVTSDPELSTTITTEHALPPVIISPLNGSIVESPHGSGVELFCTVLAACPLADSTLVTWLVNGQSVESSYLDGRALQGGRRVTMATEGCQIELRFLLVAMTEEDVSTELRCVAHNRAGREEAVTRLALEDSTWTWLLVAAVASSCFLSVVSVFLFALFKHRRKNKLDYILARQISNF